LLLVALLVAGVVLRPGPARAQENPPPTDVVEDEGGPVVITGEVDYTDPFFTLGVASPMIILEDQAGFIDRNERFIMPPESQTIGQITSDFFDPPFSYSLALPIEPQGTLRDVDNDGEEDTGVMTFAVAYWTNTWGDPFLEERDLYGGGWSTAYASTRVSEDWETRREIIGGKFLVYAPDDQQGFPSGFGEDGLLFTEDDPIVSLPQGYTVVDLDTDPFTFSRPAEADIDLIEPEGSALDDFSALPFAEAFDALLDKMRKEYAFTEYKGIDWDTLSAEFRPRFEQADADNDADAYLVALREFAWSIPDGHVSGPPPGPEFQEATGGGLGMAIRDVDDGRVIVNFLTPDGPAEEAGIELGAEIVAIDGVPVDEAVDNAVAWSAPFSTAHVERLQKLRYAVRFPLGTEVKVTWVNPGGEEQTATLETSDERLSFSASSFRGASSILDLPVQYEFIPGTDYVRVAITSFADNDLLAIQLWERMIRTLNQQGVPGLVIDMRNNLGGKGFLADQMAAYFFQEPLELGQSATYDESLDEFTIDERTTDVFYLPDESLRYDGPVAVLVGPNCASACEFFAYDMSIEDRAAIVGQYPTAGLGGGVTDALMPLNVFFRMTISRALDMDGEIHIEGKGVAPSILVPVTEETLFATGDPILEAAIEHLDAQQ
jgi:C-terminal processing protease CtpA/Prc